MPILILSRLDGPCLYTMTQAPNSSCGTNTTLARPAKASGLVVAAIAVHLLMTTMASAASTCGETIERTRMTRLSCCVAQAIRELVDHQVGERALVIVRVSDPEPISLLDDYAGLMMTGIDPLLPWLLNLPPPMG